MRWYLEVLKKYAEFDGRAHRTEFWMFVLVNVIISAVLAIFDIIIGADSGYSGLVNGLYGLWVLVPSLAVGARRLHDSGRSGWWQLLVLIPLIGLIVLIVWWAKEGDSSPNRYGPDPRERPQPV